MVVSENGQLLEVWLLMHYNEWMKLSRHNFTFTIRVKQVSTTTLDFHCSITFVLWHSLRHCHDASYFDKLSGWAATLPPVFKAYAESKSSASCRGAAATSERRRVPIDFEWVDLNARCLKAYPLFCFSISKKEFGIQTSSQPFCKKETNLHSA
ncbi:hypothetical protein IscW_ISCW005842 [Ixodes scapularis]|uniref:Uncharacterized protein n=1 Tax=Ixodes scapularis TaxID=6945 RepID=B7PQ63_IXOSC|nr:hypothetical protein IscW_ISCW005842 [Ixodes scapularis]|eukprot:XP_002435905.1 hypothetical protein IscW_ISCW005842 [Ixodes scapularis]